MIDLNRISELASTKMNLKLPDRGNPNLTLALATAIGAFGGMPAAPASFNQATKNPMMQYALLFVLIYQGGGAQDIEFSLLVTGIVFALLQVLN